MFPSRGVIGVEGSEGEGDGCWAGECAVWASEEDTRSWGVSERASIAISVFPSPSLTWGM